jgi:hypothetical protein
LPFVAGPAVQTRLATASASFVPATRSGIVSSRSTGSALNTNRTYRAATSSPQPVIAVAAICASSRRIRDASAGAKPSEATSRRSDQPPGWAYERPLGEAGEDGVAAALELVEVVGDVALVAA